MNRQPLIILDEHPNWLEPLYNELNKREVDYRKIDISSSSFNPLKDDVDYSFFVNRLSPSSGNRNHSSAFAFTLNYLLYLESLGKRVVNGSTSVILEMNKVYQSSILRNLGIPQPKSLVVNSPEQILQNLDMLTFPLIFKPNLGGSGAGIQKFLTKKSLKDAINQKTLNFPPDNLVLLQEFIQPKDNHIVRVETINKKVVYAMKVFTTGAFNLCPSDSCDLERVQTNSVENNIGYCVANPTADVRFELYKDIPLEIVKAVEKIVQTTNLECGGVEYLIDQNNNWFIYDINALSILRASFKEEYGIDGWGLLAEFFINEYQKNSERRNFENG